MIDMVTVNPYQVSSTTRSKRLAILLTNSFDRFVFRKPQLIITYTPEHRQDTEHWQIFQIRGEFILGHASPYGTDKTLIRHPRYTLIIDNDECICLGTVEDLISG